MTERKWTPGPWIEHDGNVIDTSGYEVCWDATERDAHLIAAAPDLYEALEKAQSLIKGDATGSEWKRGCAAFLSSAKEALAKARGEK